MAVSIICVAPRYAQIEIQGVWQTVDFDAVKPGQRFRLFEPDGTPVEHGASWLAEGIDLKGNCIEISNPQPAEQHSVWQPPQGVLQ